MNIEAIVNEKDITELVSNGFEGMYCTKNLNCTAIKEVFIVGRIQVTTSQSSKFSVAETIASIHLSVNSKKSFSLEGEGNHMVQTP